MRRSVLVTLAAVLVLAGACGSDGDDDTGGVATSTTTSTTEAGRPGGTEGDGADGGATSSTTTDAERPAARAVEVEEWAEGFCGEFGDWLAGIGSASDRIGASVAPGDLAGARTAIVELFREVSGRTAGLIESLEEGGAPDVERGDEFVDALVERFQEFRSAIDDARSQAADASTDDPAAFQATIAGVVSTFQAETEAVGTSFSDLDQEFDDADLQAALADSCGFA